MRKEYLQYWKETVLLEMSNLLPDFSLGKTSSSRSKLPSLNRTQVHFHRQGEGKMMFYLSFYASTSDSYNCLGGWAEDGKRSKFIVLDSNKEPFDEDLLMSREAWLDTQCLSYPLDPRESRIIGEWNLISIPNENRLSDAQLFAAILAHHERKIPDEEASPDISRSPKMAAARPVNLPP